MQSLPDTIATNVPVVNAAVAGGGDAVITVNAATTDYWQVGYVSGGYAAAPAAGALLKISLGGTVKWQVPIVGSGAFHFPFPNQGPGSLIGAKNAALVVTLTDGGQTKHLSVGYR